MFSLLGRVSKCNCSKRAQVKLSILFDIFKNKFSECHKFRCSRRSFRQYPAPSMFQVYDLTSMFLICLQANMISPWLLYLPGIRESAQSIDVALTEVSDIYPNNEYILSSADSVPN